VFSLIPTRQSRHPTLLFSIASYCNRDFRLIETKPQRFRAVGDENVPPSSLQNHKAIHQRNKSSPALSMMAQNQSNTRRAFGDVSNTKDLNRAARDDSAVGGKQVLVTEGKPGLSQPAQRPMSLSSARTIIDKVANTKPINPAGKAQPAYKATKRTNAVFKDQLQTVPETNSSKEKEAHVKTETKVPLKEAEKGIKPTPIAVVPSKATVDVSAHIESDATISEPEDIKEHVRLKEPVPAVVEPEEWDEDETEYHVAPSGPSRGDHTDGTTAVIYPRMNHVTQSQMFQAKAIVESEQTEEDREEDLLDTTMVAEYNDEIFLHLRKKEVSFALSLASFTPVETNMVCRLICSQCLTTWLIRRKSSGPCVRS
jgi:G2/mitotic-specific cyclin 3/4